MLTVQRKFYRPHEIGKLDVISRETGGRVYAPLAEKDAAMGLDA